MKRISDYKEVSPLVFRYYKRGVITNNFLSAEDYRCEIAEGNLFSHAEDDYLHIYVKRDGFFQLYFHAFNADVRFPLLSEPLVCDVVGVPDAFMQNNGFAECIRRVQLEWLATEPIGVVSAHKAEKADAKAIFTRMTECFDKFTGYTPGLLQIEKECENGMFYKIEKAGRLAGVLRQGKSGKTALIKHLCVGTEFRGQGIGKALCNEFLREKSKACVWTGKENIAALRLYESLGFKKNGVESTVYTKG